MIDEPSKTSTVTAQAEEKLLRETPPVDLAFIVPVALLIGLIAVAWQWILVGIARSPWG
ncbi:hypothetical protein QQ054_35200 [Oscillatoria amoena NRMC-F 0135]|nr:hypothetical protein [Oscillatoria amoena NRMC-F 0135]